MAGGKQNGDDDLISDINITPFVDVVLVLLVIFMVTAGVMVRRGLKVELPQAATAEEIAAQQNFDVLIGQDGQILLNGAPANLELLKTAGRDALARQTKVVVMIAADKGVAYDSVVGVMDAFRGVGITEFALELDKRSPSSASPAPR